jgi:hypothetical protein
VVTPVLLPRNLIAIDQSLKRGITTGFSFYLMTNTCVRMVLSWRAFCYCVPICMLSVFWTPSHLELYFFDRQDLFTVSDIHEQMGADIRSKDTESSSNCSGTSHMLCFFSHSTIHALWEYLSCQLLFLLICLLLRCGLWASEFELRLLLWSTRNLTEVWMPMILYHRHFPWW